MGLTKSFQVQKSKVQQCSLSVAKCVFLSSVIIQICNLFSYSQPESNTVYIIQCSFYVDLDYMNIVALAGVQFWVYHWSWSTSTESATCMSTILIYYNNHLWDYSSCGENLNAVWVLITAAIRCLQEGELVFTAGCKKYHHNLAPTGAQSGVYRRSQPM